jgi:octaprenyl-diphosphate synthase
LTVGGAAPIIQPELKLQKRLASAKSGRKIPMSQLLSASVPALQPPLDLFAPIARDLEEMERVLARTLQNSRPGVARLIDHLGHYRGKRLRPALLLLTAHACGKVTPAHHTLAAVVEMIHTATLVHDDVLDSASMRRHVPTVNSLWGNQTSILLGDYLFTHAFHLTSTLGNAEACRLIGEATNRVCGGELHQICQRGNLELTEREYFDIVDGKTAELTACCCQLSAVFSGKPADVVERLTAYGRGLGIAFQIADDLLDLIGEERTTGKSLGTDLEQQKLTLPLVHLLENAAPEMATRVRQILGNPANHKREALRPLLEQTGALAYAQRRAEEIARQARAELACLPASPNRAILETLTERVVYRSA